MKFKCPQDKFYAHFSSSRDQFETQTPSDGNFFVPMVKSFDVPMFGPIRQAMMWRYISQADVVMVVLSSELL